MFGIVRYAIGSQGEVLVGIIAIEIYPTRYFLFLCYYVSLLTIWWYPTFYRNDGWGLATVVPNQICQWYTWGASVCWYAKRVPEFIWTDCFGLYQSDPGECLWATASSSWGASKNCIQPRPEGNMFSSWWDTSLFCWNGVPSIKNVWHSRVNWVIVWSEITILALLINVIKQQCIFFAFSCD